MSSRREKILQKLNPEFLKVTPKLSVATGSFIDLNSDVISSEYGARQLMLRFLKNHDLSEKFNKNLVHNVELTISSAKYNENEEICEITSENVALSFLKENDGDCDKPGRKLQKLKMELQDKMSAKWEEEYKKRHSHLKELNSHEKKVCNGENSDSDDENCQNSQTSSQSKENLKDFNESDNESNEADEESDNENNDADDESGSAVSSDCEDDNAAEDDEKDDDNNDKASDEEEKNENVNEAFSNEGVEDELDGDGCSLIPPYQPGGGLLYGGSELTQYEEDLPQNLLSPSLQLSVNESLSLKSFGDATSKSRELSTTETENFSLEKKKLFQDSQNANDSYDLNDAFELCSGKFPDGEGASKLQSSSQMSDTNHSTSGEDLVEKTQNELCEKDDSLKMKDSEFELTNSVTKSNDNDVTSNVPKLRKNIIEFEESETEDCCEVENDQECTSTTGWRFLSDDDDDDDDDKKSSKVFPKKERKNLQFSDEEDEVNNSNAESQEEDEEEDDDEERSQKSVNYDSEENEIINPKEFFEKEAELSGSEWSGDEDERGLDEFDEEAGDADELDNDQVRSQLEKIHIRHVLDDDAREVRLIQEILFEDGDLHSDGKRRDRKFKWKSLGAFDEKENEGETKEEQGNSSEEDCAEGEELLKIRHEKELFLMEKHNKGELSSDEEIQEDKFSNLKVTSVKEELKLSVTGKEKLEKNKPLIDNLGLKKPLSLSNARGSFLTRNEEFLARLAKVTSTVTENILGPKNSKNFVFASKSPEKTNPDKNTISKRQIEEEEICVRREKKLKLFPPEVDTGPSILDLLT